MQARELLLVAAAALALSTPARADVLKVKGVTQEQSQWCWAAVSQVVLDFYGHTASQCSIAEYTRQTATWHDFGKKDCCVDPTQGCNYWNYLNTMKGAVIPILQHFGKVSAKLSAKSMTRSQVRRQIDTFGRPFVARWGWTSGSGHFVVVHGYTNDMLSYMNPWYGEGFKTAKYDWFYKASNHTWTHSLAVTGGCACTKASPCCDGCDAINSGKACDDGDLCTQQDSCQAGKCAGQAPDCGSASCTNLGQCDPLTGKCDTSMPPNGSSCDDGDACTHNDVCKAGQCAGQATQCKPADQCRLAGVCDKSTGACEHAPRPDGTSCDDKDLCSLGDACKAGQCRGAPVTCAAPGQCQRAGRCERLTGKCSYAWQPDLSGCDDGDPCSRLDLCSHGSCVGALYGACPVKVCQLASCDPASGGCVYRPRPDGTLCAGGSCKAGACVPQPRQDSGPVASDGPAPFPPPARGHGPGGCQLGARSADAAAPGWTLLLLLLWRRRICGTLR